MKVYDLLQFLCKNCWFFKYIIYHTHFMKMYYSMGSHIQNPKIQKGVYKKFYKKKSLNAWNN
jgi:hypothetical protein